MWMFSPANFDRYSQLNAVKTRKTVNWLLHRHVARRESGVEMRMCITSGSAVSMIPGLLHVTYDLYIVAIIAAT